MAYPYSITSRATGTTLTAAIYTADHQAHADNQTPENTDDYSTNAAEMQATSAPDPAATESLATTMDGELQRVRYIIKQITGRSQWYIDPAVYVTASGSLIVGDPSLTGVQALDIVLENNKSLRWENAAGTTTSNIGISLDGSNNMVVGVPAAANYIEHRWAGTALVRMVSENSGAGILFTAESSADQSAPAVNQAVIYTRDTGGKTEFVARFNSGAVQQIAIEP